MTTDTRGTTTDFDDELNWRMRAACGGRPEEFDLDVLGHKDNDLAIRAAIRVCTRQCPVFAECRDWTAALPPAQKPQALIQAGKAYKARTGHR